VFLRGEERSPYGKEEGQEKDDGKRNRQAVKRCVFSRVIQKNVSSSKGREGASSSLEGGEGEKIVSLFETMKP